MGIDQRRAPRLPLDVRVNYSFDAIAHSKDISEGGICLITEEELAAGKMLNIQFILPENERKIQAIGKIMWCRKATEHYYESGIEFWDIADKDKEAIKRYLDGKIGR